MDTQLTRTFLEVVAAGRFGAAGSRLGISQAAISMRIQLLERDLGCSLLIRNRGGISLTPAGRQFYRYAVTIRQIWDQALLDVSQPRGSLGRVRLGGHYSLWRYFLSRWLSWMRKRASNILLRIEAHGNDALTRLLSDGLLDICVLFDPQRRAGFVVQQLFEESLLLVSTVPKTTTPFDSGYLFVDWGSDFRKFHTIEFPALPLPAVQSDLGAFAVEHILQHGGSGYFPEPVVRPHLRGGRLHRVQKAPIYSTPIFAVYPEGDLEPALATALAGLGSIARKEAKLTSS